MTISVLGRVTTDLVLTNVEVVHVHQRDRISVLVVVYEHADLVERELYVKARRLFVELVVHGDLASLTSVYTSSPRHVSVTFPSPETGLSMNW